VRSRGLEEPQASERLRPALFLDRDGVINQEVNYLHRPDDVVMIAGTADAIAYANGLQIPVIVITNQAGIARGKYTEAELHAVNRHIANLISPAVIDAVYHCPHHPEGIVVALQVDCDCRKPHPGMLHRAAVELQIDLTRSVFVGDKISDLEAARAAGCGSVLVRTGYGAAVESELGLDHPLYDAVFDSLIDAMSYIGNRLRG
jgi:D-glycero-D-manno-heptose 1,7-bisphosphate phosphatase